MRKDRRKEPGAGLSVTPKVSRLQSPGKRSGMPPGAADEETLESAVALFLLCSDGLKNMLTDEEIDE